MELSKALSISASGMDVQATRLRVIAENLANQDTTGSTPGAPAYRRKTIQFADHIDHSTGAPLVGVEAIATDPSPQPLRYDPANPAANAQGYVALPNVNSFVEIMDMRDAERTYSANLSVMQATRAMLTRTINMLK
ncbi:MAG: flagellar basal body rod protein FlgC [Rhodospirillales bacterium]|nr:flagellar basal body rod protein FlgC [Rhodospirillales bacterium]